MVAVMHTGQVVSMPVRPDAIKFKINGVCVRKCVFCIHHNDRRRLEISDLERFFTWIGEWKIKKLVVNGGEPTLHPNFISICDYLKNRCDESTTLVLGTNLIPLLWNRSRYPAIRAKVLETFSMLEVGCDDEHGNIDALEVLVPEIVQAGLALNVNIVTPYCSQQTAQRILALAEQWPIILTYSGIDHWCDARKRSNDVSYPCTKRYAVIMIDCNGDAFFCYNQEMENPVFNLHEVTSSELLYYLNEHDPGVYKFCSFCPRYRPDIPGAGLSQRLNRLKVSVRKRIIRLRETIRTPH